MLVYNSYCLHLYIYVDLVDAKFSLIFNDFNDFHFAIFTFYINKFQYESLVIHH